MQELEDAKLVKRLQEEETPDPSDEVEDIMAIKSSQSDKVDDISILTGISRDELEEVATKPSRNDIENHDDISIDLSRDGFEDNAIMTSRMITTMM